MEEALLPPVEDFPDAEERRLMYVALTGHAIGYGHCLTKRILSICRNTEKSGCAGGENRKKQVAFATCAILLQTVREITLIIGDQNIDRVVEMRRLDNEVCRCHVGGNRNVPYRRQTQQGFHVRVVRHGV